MSIANQIRALKLTGHSPMPVFDSTWNAALDRAAALAEAHESALVAAAYAAAAERVKEYPSLMLMTPDQAEVCRHLAVAIHYMTPADARAALGRMLAEARKDGMREAASQIMAVAKSLPVQHESKERGQCTYNWARWAEGIILAAAEKEAGK